MQNTDERLALLLQSLDSDVAAEIKGFLLNQKTLAKGSISDSNTLGTEFSKINWSKKTILIAEDERSNYTYLESALAFSKITILWAKNGREAVNLVKVHPEIDVILMDIKMPQMNGIEATRLIRSYRSDLTIIAQTAFVMDEDRRNCLAVGCNDFLAKPIQHKTLINTLVPYLG